MDPSPSSKGDAEKHGGGFSLIDSQPKFPEYRGSGYPIDRRSQDFICGHFRTTVSKNLLRCVFSRSSALRGGDSASCMRSCGGLDNAAYRCAADVQTRSDLALADSLREQCGDLRLVLLNRWRPSVGFTRFSSFADACAPQLFGADANQSFARLVRQQCDMIERCCGS
jgi:hypothetical protein